MRGTDTDSVFVHIPESVSGLRGEEAIAAAMRMGKEAAAMVTRNFKHPVSLEYEKVFCPLLLLGEITS